MKWWGPFDDPLYFSPSRGRAMTSAYMERFWDKVETGDGCWLWTGAQRRQGYGSFWDGERQASAHRLSYAMRYGGIPDGLCVLHRCDTPRCVNPSHLFLGSVADNARDMAEKGRTIAKLARSDVQLIRLRYARGGVSYRKLASEYGVDESTIREAIGRKGGRRSWKHVS